MEIGVSMSKKTKGKAKKRLPKTGKRVSIYDAHFCVDFKGKRYERMFGNPWGHKYSQDDFYRLAEFLVATEVFGLMGSNDTWDMEQALSNLVDVSLD